MHDTGMKKKINQQRGIAALATTLFLGGIIVEIALAGILAVTYLTSSNAGVRFSAEARAAAESALQESLLRIIRNKNIPQGNSANAWNRSIDFPVGNATAKAVVCTSFSIEPRPISNGCNPAGSANGGEYIIVAIGTRLNRKYELRATTTVDTITGKMTLQSAQEVPYDQ